MLGCSRMFSATILSVLASQTFRVLVQIMLRDVFIPEGAGRCQGGFGLQFCGGMAFGGHDGMALWLAFPDRCRVRASGLAGQGPGGARPRSGAAGVLDAPTGEPIMAGAGERPRACARAMRLCAPHCRRCGWQACWLPSSLRVCPGLAGRGAWGGSRPEAGGSITFPFSPPGPAPGAGYGGEHKTSRPRPSGPAAHAAWLMARRRCPSRRA